jgi:hypothetical protein
MIYMENPMKIATPPELPTSAKLPYYKIYAWHPTRFSSQWRFVCTRNNAEAAFREAERLSDHGNTVKVIVQMTTTIFERPFNSFKGFVDEKAKGI